MMMNSTATPTHIPLPSAKGSLSALMSKIKDLEERYAHLEEYRNDYLGFQQLLILDLEKEQQHRLHCARILEDIEYDSEILDEEYEMALERLQIWKATYRAAFRTWRSAMEEEGYPIHKVKFLEMPNTPPSLLMYIDTDDDNEGRPYLVFPRAYNGRYTSAPFWSEYEEDSNPVDRLGTRGCQWVSSVQLGCSPEVLEELYALETRYMETRDESLIEKIQAIRSTFRPLP